MEGDPSPSTGRMSFKGFNPATEQLEKSIRNDRKDLFGDGDASAGQQHGTTVTDEEMAEKYGSLNYNL